MTATHFDVVVVGAGPAGLAAALALSKAGARTALVGPEPARRDGRTAALIGRSVELLTSLGIWPVLAPKAGALRALRVIDDTGSLFRPPPVTFRAAEVGQEALGWNVENAHLATALAAAARADPGLAWITGTVDRFDAKNVARVSLADGTMLEAALAVAADGRNSRLRTDAGIAVRERRYPQSAFTTILRHEGPHDDTSTEFQTRSGPMTLVPLPDRRSSLVWVTQPRHAERLRVASDEDLARAVETATRSILGRCAVDGPRGVVPLAAMSVRRLVGNRLALIGEAAHVLPPLGAQGLNLGLADVDALIRAVAGELRTGGDAGSGAVLARYERARRLDIGLRSIAVDGLNRALLSGSGPLDALRGFGLGALGQIGPLRRAVMRAGLSIRRPGAFSPETAAAESSRF